MYVLCILSPNVNVHATRAPAGVVDHIASVASRAKGRSVSVAAAETKWKTVRAISHNLVSIEPSTHHPPAWSTWLAIQQSGGERQESGGAAINAMQHQRIPCFGPKRLCARSVEEKRRELLSGEQEQSLSRTIRTRSMAPLSSKRSVFPCHRFRHSFSVAERGPRGAQIRGRE